jgi:exo-beta-1,3-glucanase (GH17 family)
MSLFRLPGLALLGLLALPILGQAPATPVDLARQGWHGQAICYSGYRLGQHPDRQAFPSEAEVLEDLRLLERQWQLIRVYGSDRHSLDVLTAIQRHGIRLQVMLGIWLSGKPGKEAENRRQLAEGIRLAKAFPAIVTAVNVGNEALVTWSDHRLSEPEVIAFVKQVKAAVPCRVTVADDFLYWSQPGNQLAKHLDFITMHTYPLWGNQDIDEAMATTAEKVRQIRKLYPQQTIVLGEAGWASFTEPHKQIVARAGDETKQKRYYEELNAWAKAQGVTSFLFEAFDEPWKGEGTEGHWGVFSVERKAKLVMRERFPDRLPSGPTSPGYGPAVAAKPKPEEK